MRCKINPKYTCTDLYKTGKGKWNTSNPCFKCSIFANSEQNVFNQFGEVIDVSFEQEMDRKVAENPELIPVTEIPDEVEALVRDFKFKADARGNEALFVTLLTKEKKRIIQKYTSSSYSEVKDAVRKAGGMDVLKITMWAWKKDTFGQMKQPRLLPVPIPRVQKASK